MKALGVGVFLAVDALFFGSLVFAYLAGLHDTRVSDLVPAALPVLLLALTVAAAVVQRARGPLLLTFALTAAALAVLVYTVFYAQAAGLTPRRGRTGLTFHLIHFLLGLHLAFLAGATLVLAGRGRRAAETPLLFRGIAFVAAIVAIGLAALYLT